MPKSNKKGINLNYCDYNLTTTIDSKGGFLIDSTEPQVISKATHDPPVSMQNVQERCKECQSIDISQEYWQHYKVYVCRECIKNNPNYALLTKTEVRQG